MKPIKYDPSMHPYVIAEVGSNWHALSDCMAAIEGAKRCDAQAVKFQLYTHEELYGYSNPDPKPGDSKWELPRDWVPILANHCKRVGIDFMCSAFSADGVKFLDPFVKMHKIATCEASDLEITGAAGETNKPFMVSLGARTFEEMSLLVKLTYSNNMIPTYCVGSYPDNEASVERMKDWADSFDREFMCAAFGFSDHTTDINIISRFAADLNFGFIEKHVNFLDRNNGGRDTLDAPHSIDPFQLEHYIQRTRTSVVDLETAVYQKNEQNLRTHHLRRLVAIAPLKEGDELIYGQNCSFKRPKSDYADLKDCVSYYSSFPIERLGKKMLFTGKTARPGQIILKDEFSINN